MKRLVTYFFLISIGNYLLPNPGYGQRKKKDAEQTSYYQIRVYHFTKPEQEKMLDEYLSQAFKPVAHAYSLGPVGVFKPIANDTALDKRIYVLTSASSFEKLNSLAEKMEIDASYISNARPFVNAPYNEPAYDRYESILLKAFPMAYYLEVPILLSPKEEHIYELRSYEGPTDGLYKSKVAMFNEGGEIDIFKRLGFNAVIYGEVINGSRMPNLMYMTSFENKTARDEHWKAFGADEAWKKLSALPQYQHTVSKMDIILMRAATYSDY